MPEFVATAWKCDWRIRFIAKAVSLCLRGSGPTVEATDMCYFSDSKSYLKLSSDYSTDRPDEAFLR